MPTGGRSGLRTRTAATESVRLFADDMPTAFLELESAIRVAGEFEKSNRH
jgi:hypothetical protein